MPRYAIAAMMMPLMRCRMPPARLPSRRFADVYGAAYFLMRYHAAAAAITLCHFDAAYYYFRR